MERGLADTHDGRRGQRAGRVEPGVVEAGDDVRAHALRFPLRDLGEQAGDGERVVVEAFDALGTDRRVHGDDARARRGSALISSSDIRITANDTPVVTVPRA